MYVSINNILYFIGAVLSIMMLIPNSSSILSFFSRKRIIQLLRDENQELDDALKALRKWYYYDYDAFTVFPIITIFFVLGISSAIQFTPDVDQIIIIIVYSAFILFSLVISWKLSCRTICEGTLDSSQICLSDVLWCQHVSRICEALTPSL